MNCIRDWYINFTFISRSTSCIPLIKATLLKYFHAPTIQRQINSRPLKTHSKPNQNHPIFPTIQINKTAFYPAPQKTLGILQKISPVFAKTKK
ncbi:hypothetical protein [uncultured Gammaproteobacteria bacterium]|nr:hypothetical protein [uncultured Gammaproteobacteria bacterium]